MKTVALLAGIVAFVTCAVHAAEEKTTTPSRLVGTWTGKMMNPKGSIHGIETTVTFAQDTGSGRITGTVRFKNLDLNVQATGEIDRVSVESDTVRFVVKFHGGAPGVDGTEGQFKLRFETPDSLAGDGQREQSYLFWRMNRAQQ